MDDFTPAQPYDMSEYWAQFDDRSRWKGFSPTPEKHESIISEDDEIIEAINYLGKEYMNDEQITSEHLRTTTPIMHLEDLSKKREISLVEQTNGMILKSKMPVESRLQEIFDKMKETVK